MKKQFDMKKLFKIAFIGLLAIGMVACKKIEGPKGQKGDQGEQGIQGPAGPTGNANVISTNQVTVNAVNWIQEGYQYYSVLTVNAITQEVSNTGFVQVFEKVGDQWWALPVQYGKNQTSFGMKAYTIVLENQNVDGSMPFNPGTKTFRVVVIPSSFIQANPNVNWNSLEEIEKLQNQ